MRQIIPIICFIAGPILFSCKEKKDITEIQKSYIIIRSAIGHANQIQDSFFVEAVQRLGEVKYNVDAVVDTKELQILLDRAKASNETEINIIANTKEPDEEIKYKEKAIQFVKLLNAIYNDEFSEFISILNSKPENRFDSCQVLLYEKMRAMSKAMHDCADASASIRKKYDIK